MARHSGDQKTDLSKSGIGGKNGFQMVQFSKGRAIAMAPLFEKYTIQNQDIHPFVQISSLGYQISDPIQNSTIRNPE